MKGESAKESERAREGGSEREMFRNQVRERGTRTGGREGGNRKREEICVVCVCEYVCGDDAWKLLV